MLPRKTERGYAESDNRNLEQLFLPHEFPFFLHFSLNLLLPQATRQYFREFMSILFLSHIRHHQLTFVLPTSVICLPFPAGNAISPAGNKCSQSGMTNKYARTEATRSLYVVQTLSILTIIDRGSIFKVVSLLYVVSNLTCEFCEFMYA